MWNLVRSAVTAVAKSGVPQKILGAIGTGGSKLLEGAKTLFSKAAPSVSAGLKSTGKAAVEGLDAGSLAMKTAKEGGEKFSKRLLKGVGATAQSIGGSALNSKTMSNATAALDGVAATHTGATSKVASGLSSLINKAKGSKAAKVAAAGGIATAGLYATGNGDIVENVVNTAGNVANAGAEALTHLPDATSAVGSGINAIADLASTVTGAISDLTAGNFTGAIGRFGEFATNHPMATAVGLGGGALMLGGGGIVGKVAAVGAGLMLGKTVMDNVSKSESAEATTSGFASGTSAEAGSTSQATADDLTAAMEQTAQAEAQQAALTTTNAGAELAASTQMDYGMGQ